jgi:uncharacterized RDD family membrane protein YckC
MVSGEAVTLELDRAGGGSRTVASAIDLSVQLVVFIAVTIGDAFVAGGDDAVIAALLLTEYVLIFGGYPTMFEWLSRGRTLGKLALGLRVVRDDGGPIGFRQALVRGLSSLLLEKPGLIFPFGAALGLGMIAFSSSSKRVGDHLAGTFVLQERAGGADVLAVAQFGVPYQLQPWAMALDLTRFDDRLAYGVRQFVIRANAMSPQAQQALGEDFRGRVLAVVTPPPPPGTPTPLVLTTVLAERRRRAEYAAGRRP